MREHDPIVCSQQEVQQLSQMLFSLRDSLVRLSLALKDSPLVESLENQELSQALVTDMLSKLMSKPDP